MASRARGSSSLNIRHRALKCVYRAVSLELIFSRRLVILRAKSCRYNAIIVGKLTLGHFVFSLNGSLMKYRGPGFLAVSSVRIYKVFLRFCDYA